MIALAPDDPLRVEGLGDRPMYVRVVEVRRLPPDGQGAAIVVDFVGTLQLVEGAVTGPTWGAAHDHYEIAATSFRPWAPRRERAPRRRRGAATGVVTETGTGTEDIDG